MLISKGVRTLHPIRTIGGQTLDIFLTPPTRRPCSYPHKQQEFLKSNDRRALRSLHPTLPTGFPLSHAPTPSAGRPLRHDSASTTALAPQPSHSAAAAFSLCCGLRCLTVVATVVSSARGRWWPRRAGHRQVASRLPTRDRLSGAMASALDNEQDLPRPTSRTQPPRTRGSPTSWHIGRWRWRRGERWARHGV